MNNLLNNVEIVRVKTSQVAGTADVVSDAVDMAGWTGVMFVAALGDVTSTSALALKAQQCDTSGGSYAAITGGPTKTAGATDSDNLCLVLDIVRPSKQFVQAVLSRGTANAVVDGLIAVKYGPLHRPPVQGATIIGAATIANP